MGRRGRSEAAVISEPNVPFANTGRQSLLADRIRERVEGIANRSENMPHPDLLECADQNVRY
jgi:hypothetical protein